MAAWGLADGGNVISPDSEMVFYGILDVLAKPVFCFFHLFMLSRLDLTVLQLNSGKFTTSGAGFGGSGIGGGFSNNDPEKNRMRNAAIPADRHAGRGESSGTVGFAGGKGLFSKRKGAYDAPPTSNTNTTGDIAGTNNAPLAAEPRISQTTAVSRE